MDERQKALDDIDAMLAELPELPADSIQRIRDAMAELLWL